MKHHEGVPLDSREEHLLPFGARPVVAYLLVEANVDRASGSSHRSWRRRARQRRRHWCARSQWGCVAGFEFVAGRLERADDKGPRGSESSTSSTRTARRRATAMRRYDAACTPSVPDHLQCRPENPGPPSGVIRFASAHIFSFMSDQVRTTRTYSVSCPSQDQGG